MLFDLEQAITDQAAAWRQDIIDNEGFDPLELGPLLPDEDRAELLDSLASFRAELERYIPPAWWAALGCRVEARRENLEEYVSVLAFTYDSKPWLLWRDYFYNPNGLWSIQGPLDVAYDLGEFDPFTTIWKALAYYRSFTATDAPLVLPLERS
jgi:hypothetical protein